MPASDVPALKPPDKLGALKVFPIAPTAGPPPVGAPRPPKGVALAPMPPVPAPPKGLTAAPAGPAGAVPPNMNGVEPRELIFPVEVLLFKPPPKGVDVEDATPNGFEAAAEGAPKLMPPVAEADGFAAPKVKAGAAVVVAGTALEAPNAIPPPAAIPPVLPKMSKGLADPLPRVLTEGGISRAERLDASPDW